MAGTALGMILKVFHTPISRTWFSLLPSPSQLRRTFASQSLSRRCANHTSLLNRTLWCMQRVPLWTLPLCSCSPTIRKMISLISGLRCRHSRPIYSLSQYKNSCTFSLTNTTLSIQNTVRSSRKGAVCVPFKYLGPYWTLYFSGQSKPYQNMSPSPDNCLEH